MVSCHISAMRACLDNASDCLSILFPSTRSGIPVKEGLLNKSWSSVLAIDMFSLFAASKTYLDDRGEYRNNIYQNTLKFSDITM